MNKIRVLVKRPNEPPRSVWISDTLENLQRYVGGYIEVFPLATDMVVICDEEGRLKKKEYNCDICGVPFVGEIILAGRNGECGIRTACLIWHSCCFFCFYCLFFLTR